MCNLLRYKDTTNRLAESFAEIRDIRITPKINFKVAPSEPAPVLSLQAGGLQVGMMRFGFETARGRQMMARGETVEKLPTFKEGFRSRRCLILAHGFYDSENLGPHLPKQPWHIHLKDDELMCFAGLWEGDSFTIVSAPANQVVARVIDRMPVILPQELWRPWMDAETPAETLKAMLRPYPAAEMEAYPVTRQVNQKGFNGPECVVPVQPAQPDLGLF